MKHKYGALILAIKNDFCLQESVEELFRQGASEVLIVSPYYYWIDRLPQLREDFEEMVCIANKTGARIARADFKSEASANAALYTEALYRDFGVETLSSSVDWVLTCDADEFWLPGTLNEIDNLIATSSCSSVVLPGIPVIGIPGLPVARAKDTILVASSKGTKFKWGRSAEGPRVNGTIPVLHFSATRRTMNELVCKVHKSAHYSDSSYDFDGWLKNVVPRVEAGMKNVHMYRSPENIWPEVRTWTKEELAVIPPSLHPFIRL